MLRHVCITSQRPLHFLQRRRRATATWQPQDVAPVMMAYNSYEATEVDAGRPPLIVLHGLFGSKTNYTSVCKSYQRALGCRVYAVDLRNHGDSPHTSAHSYPHLAADLRHFMTSLGIASARLVGHSMGGRAAMFFTLQHPHLVEKLVVVDISPFTNSHSLIAIQSLFEFMAQVALPAAGVPLAEARRTVDRQLAARIADRMLRGFLLTNLVQRADGAHAWRINLAALRANFAGNIANFPNMSDSRYDGATLFLGGDQSDYLPKDSLPELQRFFPNAQLQYIANAGHWVHSDQPQEFLSVTTAFLRE